MRSGWRLGTACLIAVGAVGCARPLPILPDQGTDGSSSGEDPGVDTSDGATTEGADSTGPIEPGCGNGVIEAGETCDDRGESAQCNADCTSTVCGDGIINQSAGEACDGQALAGETCESQGFSVGELACDGQCAYDTDDCAVLPAAPVLALDLSAIKRFDFSWGADSRADYYQLEERITGDGTFVQIGEDLFGESISHEVPLHLRADASYRLRACNDGGCVESAVVDVTGSLAAAVGYVKASNTDANDSFGASIGLSADGMTLVVGAANEDSDATGVGGSQASDAAPSAGAAYVFSRDGLGVWSQAAYLKASNSQMADYFGTEVAVSGDGSTIAVSALGEDSGATGVGGAQDDETAASSGAVYVFTLDGKGAWSQMAYLKASNTAQGDTFGFALALSGDGDTLAVGALGEGSAATGVNGDENDNSLLSAGAVYVFDRDDGGAWSQAAYIKASNPDEMDQFGHALALSADGETLAVGARGEDGNSTGIGGNQANDSATGSGAVYVFTRDGTSQWGQQEYIKASNTDPNDMFGGALALSHDGDVLVVGAGGEDSAATGVGGNTADNTVSGSGAVYVFDRDVGGAWSQGAYLKAFHSDAVAFGTRTVAVSGDGSRIAVGASSESSGAVGINGDVTDRSAQSAGAVYMFQRDRKGDWTTGAYVKSPNTNAGDQFGIRVALSGNAHTLAVGANGEASDATGIGALQDNNNASDAGATYLY